MDLLQRRPRRRCTWRSTARWSRAARRRARWPTTPSPSSTRTRTRSSSCGCTSTIRTCRTSRTPRCRRSARARMDLYDGEIRFTDLHVGRVLAHLRAAGPLGQDGHRASPAITARASASTASPSTASTSTRRRRACRSSCACRGCRRSGWRAPAGHVDIAPTLVNLARGKPSRASSAARWSPSSPGAARPPTTDTRAVFQEVTSERGKKRALVTHDAATSSGTGPPTTPPSATTARRSRPRRTTCGDAAGDRACVRLKRASCKRMVAGAGVAAGRRREDGAPRDAARARRRRAGAPARRHLGDAIEVRGYDCPPPRCAPGGEVDGDVHFASSSGSPNAGGSSSTSRARAASATWTTSPSTA